MTHTTETKGSDINFLSVLKASQVISKEMDINRLSESLLRIAMENAGAQNGVLFINIDDEFIIQSMLKVNGTKKQLMPIEPNDNVDYPVTIIDFVTRTKKIVVLANAGRSDYRKDEYIRKKNAKSVLCMPLVRNDLIVAILYLENNDVADAFTDEHIEIFKLLSIQAIISLENVKFHESAKQKTKDRFLAHVSHEIRTPIHSILGYTELLKKHIDDESIRSDYLQNITHSGKLLLELIDDVLEFAISENGKLRINKHPLSLQSIITEIKRIFSSKMASKGLKFDIQLDSEFNNKLIKFDERRLMQILINLIDNACKYTNEGYVSVSIQEKVKGKNIIDLLVIVEDSSIGISDTCRIFKEFEQVSDHSYTGFGLGLAIVKNTLKELNGTITVNSKLNKGSTFEVIFENIECISGYHLNTPYKEKPEPKIEFNLPTVLIVDDDLSETFIKSMRDTNTINSILNAMLMLEEKWDVAVNTIFMASTGFSVMANGEEIKKFAANIQKLGTKYRHERLVQWGSDLYHHINKLNLNEANKMLKQFPKIVNDLKEKLKKLNYPKTINKQS